MKKIYIISGEASGDIHGGNMLKELLNLRTDVQVRAWGGERLDAAGATIVKHYKDLAFMGFTEVLLNLRTIINNLKFCKQDILDYQPDVIVLIDYPGFNLKIAEWAHDRGIKVIYYISPKLWAWKKGRVKIIKRCIKRMITILPFEKDFYEDYGVKVDYVGNPLLDEIQQQDKTIAKELLAIIPGSRTQEITRILPVMLSVAQEYGLPFAIAKAPSLPSDLYYQVAGTRDLKFMAMSELLQQSKLALVSSGTATLETALYEVPQVVCYKAGEISYRIAMMVVKLDYISLVNLIMNRLVVSELIQHKLTHENLMKELKSCDDHRELIISDYRKLKEMLGSGRASLKAAEVISSEL